MDGIVVLCNTCAEMAGCRALVKFNMLVSALTVVPIFRFLLFLLSAVPLSLLFFFIFLIVFLLTLFSLFNVSNCSFYFHRFSCHPGFLLSVFPVSPFLLLSSSPFPPVSGVVSVFALFFFFLSVSRFLSLFSPVSCTLGYKRRVQPEQRRKT